MVKKFQRIYTSTTAGAFEEMLRDALSQVDADGAIKLAIFNLPANNSEYKKNLETIENITKEVFGELSPLTSYISQKTSHGGVTIEATYIADTCATIEHHRNYKLISHNGCREIITGGIIPRFDEGSTFEQSTDIFEGIGEMLSVNSFRTSDIYRQWNYIPGITMLNDGSQNYQEFERARLLGGTILISGTAAIKGECSNYSTDAVEQAAETMEIMNRLTSKENVPVENNGSTYDLLRVYVKRENDIPAVCEYMQQHYPATQKHYLVADVCRPELLIEIEGVAHI